jgi:hypothetical protein
MNLCQYKTMLGLPGKGIHSYRIGDIAVVDVVLTCIGAFILSYLFNTSFWKTLIVLFILGIFFHRIFCVKTTVDKFLFP